MVLPDILEARFVGASEDNMVVAVVAVRLAFLGAKHNDSLAGDFAHAETAMRNVQGKELY